MSGRDVLWFRLRGDATHAFDDAADANSLCGLATMSGIDRRTVGDTGPRCLLCRDRVSRRRCSACDDPIGGAAKMTPNGVICARCEDITP